MNQPVICVKYFVFVNIFHKSFIMLARSVTSGGVWMENRFNCLHISTSYNSFLCTPCPVVFVGKAEESKGRVCGWWVIYCWWLVHWPGWWFTSISYIWHTLHLYLSKTWTIIPMTCIRSGQSDKGQLRKWTHCKIHAMLTVDWKWSFNCEREVTEVAIL